MRALLPLALALLALLTLPPPAAAPGWGCAVPVEPTPPAQLQGFPSGLGSSKAMHVLSWFLPNPDCGFFASAAPPCPPLPHEAESIPFLSSPQSSGASGIARHCDNLLETGAAGGCYWFLDDSQPMVPATPAPQAGDLGLIVGLDRDFDGSVMINNGEPLVGPVGENEAAVLVNDGAPGRLIAYPSRIDGEAAPILMLVVNVTCGLA